MSDANYMGMEIVGKRLFKLRLFETIRYVNKYFRENELSLSIPVYIVDDIHQWIKREGLSISQELRVLFNDEVLKPKHNDMFIEFIDEEMSVRFGLHIVTLPFQPDSDSEEISISKNAMWKSCATCAFFDGHINVFDYGIFNLTFFTDEDGLIVHVENNYKGIIEVPHEYYDDPEVVDYAIDMANFMQTSLFSTMLMINRNMLDIKSFSYEKTRIEEMQHFLDMVPHDDYRTCIVKDNIFPQI